MFILVLIELIPVVIIVAGLVLNLIIVTSFWKRRIVRRSIPNFLLFNQSIADLFNVAVYGVARTTFRGLLMFNKRYDIAMLVMLFSLSVSVFSSALLHNIIAVERCLSIYFPLWHKVYLLKKHLWIAVIILWIVSIVIGICNFIIEILTLNHTIFSWFVTISICSSIVITTITFIATFIKAFVSIKSSQTRSISNSNTNWKKQLRLTAIFFVMFTGYIIVYIPWTAIAFILKSSPTSGVVELGIMRICFLLTSVINPVITLCFKRQFRPCQPNAEPHASRQHIEMHQVRNV